MTKFCTACAPLRCFKTFPFILICSAHFYVMKCLMLAEQIITDWNGLTSAFGRWCFLPCAVDRDWFLLPFPPNRFLCSVTTCREWFIFVTPDLPHEDTDHTSPLNLASILHFVLHVTPFGLREPSREPLITSNSCVGGYDYVLSSPNTHYFLSVHFRKHIIVIEEEQAGW